ncbi:MAG: hypothetical protein ABSD97_13015 [Acidimicrobiales bacterium]
MTPFRIVDTRTGATDPATYAGQTLAANSTLNVQVTGVGTTPVPAGASAVVLNVTAVAPTKNGYLTVFPEGTTQPLVSNLNFAPKEIVANLVTVPLSTAGGISIYNFAGSTDVVVDVEGYYTSSPATNNLGLYTPLSPYRALGSLAAGAPIAANTAVPVTVTGTATGVPGNASAVVVNVTAEGATNPSFLTVYPAGATQPVASNLNFGIQGTNVAIANRATVGVGTNGQIEVYNHTGSVNVDVDVDGYYSGAGGAGSVFVPITPVRVADTRTISTVGTQTPIPANTSEKFLLATTTSGIPATATAVATNVTVVPADAAGYLTVYPSSDTTPPVASDVNWVANQSPAVPNFTIADTAGTGSVELYASAGASINVIVDAFGYFTTAAPAVTGLNIAVPSTTPAVGQSLVAENTNNETVTVTVTRAGSPVIGDTVLFTVAPTTGTTGSQCGTILPATDATNASGVATSVYTAPNYAAGVTAASCTITAEDADYGQVGTGTIAQTAPGNTVAVVANPTHLVAGGGLTSALTATIAGATDASDAVTFAVSPTTGCGTISNSSGSTPAAGPFTVTATYTAGTTSGFCTVTATEANTKGTGSAVIDQTATTPIVTPTVTIAPAAPANQEEGTTSSAYTVTVLSTSAGTPPVANDPLSFAVTAGTSTSCGTLTPSATTTGAAGTVTFTYTAGTGAGTCDITVTEAEDGVTSAALVITQTAIPPTVTVGANPAAVPIGTASALTVTVANPGAGDAGGAVTFTVAPAASGGAATCGAAPAAGTLTATSPYTATSSYNASSSIGFCVITAHTVSTAMGSVTVDQTA